MKSCQIFTPSIYRLNLSVKRKKVQLTFPPLNKGAIVTAERIRRQATQILYNLNLFCLR
jgi:hypothetical protein